MWKPIYDPGPWKAYLSKKENKGLPIMEVRKKYLKEQLEFEDFRGVVSSTLSPSLASSVAAPAGKSPSPEPRPVPSIFPPKIYVQTEFTLTQGSSNISRTSVGEYIKYSDVGDEAWNGKPVYFSSRNVVDSENYDYDPNGVFGNYIRYNFSSNRWEVTGCGGSTSFCVVNTLQFGVPIPSAEALPEWGNLIGEWDVLDDNPSGTGGCITSTYVGPPPGPKKATSYVVSINTYTEDPGTANPGTTSLSYQENGKYILPESVYNGNGDLACGEEPQPCNLLFSEVKLTILRSNLLGLTQILPRADSGDLINGRTYWTKFLDGKRGSPPRRWTIRWNGNNWEIAYIEGSNPETVISTNTNHTGEVPYDCNNVTGDAPMQWEGLYPPTGDTNFTTEQDGIAGAAMDFRIQLGSVSQKLTATSEGEDGPLINNEPIYTVNDGTSDYVVRWNGAYWEITKSTGGSNPVVITTDTDVTGPWYELPNNVVTWTMIPGENVITTGSPR